MRARGLVLLLAALGMAHPRPAHAQEFALAGEGGYFDLTSSSNSAKAVFGSAGGVTFGGDLRVALGKRFFLRGGARYFKKTGERVFLSSATGTVFPLKDEPLSAKIIPVELTLGYFFRPRTSVDPYIGVGGGFASYKEESTVGGVTTSQSQTKAQGHVVGGVEFGKGEFRFGVEVNYSVVPNALGVGGVSQIYNETGIGGLAVLGKLIFTSPRR